MGRTSAAYTCSNCSNAAANQCDNWLCGQCCQGCSHHQKKTYWCTGCGRNAAANQCDQWLCGECCQGCSHHRKKTSLCLRCRKNQASRQCDNGVCSQCCWGCSHHAVAEHTYFCSYCSQNQAASRCDHMLCGQCCLGCSHHAAKSLRCTCGNAAAVGCDDGLCAACCTGCSRHGDGGVWQERGRSGKTRDRYEGKRQTWDWYEGNRPQTALRKFLRELQEYKLPREYDQGGALGKVAMRRLAAEGVVLPGASAVPALNATNARALLRELLWTEEAQLKRDIKTYDKYIRRPLERASQGHGYYWIRVPGLLEKRPSVLRGDFVWVTQSGFGRSFKSWVHNIEEDRVCVHLPTPFDNAPPFNVRFSFPRTPYRNMHRALEENPVDVFSPAENFELMMLRASVKKAYAEAQAGSSALLHMGAWFMSNFVGAPEKDCSMMERVRRLATKLNFDQTLFVEVVLAPVKKPFPVLCWGPPGTGKTTTVCEAIRELLHHDAGARCLVCAPSNAAVDVLCERLGKLGVAPGAMIRLNAHGRAPREVPPGVLPFSPRQCAKGVTDPEEAAWVIPRESEFEQYRVILCTCSFAATVLNCFRVGSPALETLVSHCFVDEAGQTMEPEAWIPLCLLRPGGKVFFIGDHKQLGSVVHNSFASKMGLDVSIQERLWTLLGGGAKDNATRCFTLLRSYRSHLSILRLFNPVVYGGMLQCCTDVSAVRRFEDMGTQGHPVIFHHVVGQEEKLKDSPSWVNMAELELVKHYVTELVVSRGVGFGEIGVISPYRKQCSIIRKWLAEQGWGAIEVGTVEVFQGNEREAIVISTVRSQQRGDDLQADMRYNIGFLGSFRRTNVALSRARSLVVVVGNLELLGQDETWMKVLREVVAMGAVRTSLGGPPAAAASPAPARRWRGLSREEVVALIPSVGRHQVGRLREDTCFTTEVDADTGRLRVQASYQHLIVVDDGVRHAQGTRGLGLGTSSTGRRFDEGEGEDAANPEAAWREFE